MEIERKIRTYGGYFEEFMKTLTENEQNKIQYGLLLLKTQERLSRKFVSLIRDGIFELRTEYNSNIYKSLRDEFERLPNLDTSLKNRSSILSMRRICIGKLDAYYQAYVKYDMATTITNDDFNN